jgi:hypothetical protein
VLQVTGDLRVPWEVIVSEATATFEDIVGPMRAEFAIDAVTGDLLLRRPGLVARLLRGLAVLGCAQGNALCTSAATGIHGADGRPQEK